MKKLNIRYIMIIVVAIILILLAVLIMTSRAYLSDVSIGDQESTISVSSCSNINMSGGFDNSITIENAYPVSNNVGLNTEPYEFTISNMCGTLQDISVYIVVNDKSNIDASDIKIYYGTTEEEKEINLLSDNLFTNFSGEYIEQYETLSGNTLSSVYHLGTYTLSENDIENLSLRLWISSGSEVSAGDIFSATILVGDSEVIESGVFPSMVLLNSTGTNTIKEAITSIEEKETPDFSAITETNEGLFATEDNYGTSYYFRGAVDNNWVYFGGFYWRIVRIDGEGNIKLIYTGSTAPTESESVAVTGDDTSTILSKAFNTSCTGSYCIGYMYTSDEWRGYTTSSTIKTEIDTWYEENLIDYSSDLADVIYCSDRTSYTSEVGTTPNTKYVTGTTQYYGSYLRVKASISSVSYTPSLLCEDKDDSFTVDDDVNGNAALTYPIALLSADEASFAGLTTVNNELNYLYTDIDQWLLSPFETGNSTASLFAQTSGMITSNVATSNLNAKVVISLKSNVSYIEGNGTYNNPYVIE